MRWPVLLIGALVGAGGQTPRPGEGLVAGMVLEYSTGTGTSKWVIDSVAGRGDPECGRVWLRRDTTSESRHDCVRAGVLERWSDGSSRWVEQRPVGLGGRRSYRRGAGTVEFLVEGFGVDTISGAAVPVVVTTVTTFDSAGVARRRLRERYAIGLTTATWGRFEAMDAGSPSGWTTQQEFRLVAIRR